jgi:hypothetical protein
MWLEHLKIFHIEIFGKISMMQIEKLFISSGDDTISVTISCPIDIVQYLGILAGNQTGNEIRRISLLVWECYIIESKASTMIELGVDPNMTVLEIVD